MPLGIYFTVRLLPAHVVAESRTKADAWLAQSTDKPRNYLAAAFIVFVWIALAWWAWRVWAG